MFRRWVCTLLFIHLLHSGVTYGQDLSQTFPKLESHSDTNVVVYSGDKLSLKANVQGSDYNATWIRQREVLCSDTKCDIDTTDWKMGVHKIVLVVYNNFGSRSVTYRVKVFTRKPGTEPQSIVPKDVPFEVESESINPDDLVAFTQKGIGYAYSDEKVQVVASVPRVLKWNETLKTEARSVLEFGRPSVDQHFLVGKSQAKLVSIEESRRVINLKSGFMRSRQLAEEDPNWSLVVSDWLQVDSDKKGDLILSRMGRKSKERAVVQVLRGVARLVFKLDNQSQSQSLYVPQGSRVEIYRSGTVGALRPLTSVVGKVLRKTTRQYIFPTSEAEESSVSLDRRGWLLDPASLTNDIREAKRLAQSALKDNDPFAGIEYLKKFSKGSDRRVHVILSKAYFSLGAYAKAQFHLEQVQEEARDLEWKLNASRISLLKRDYGDAFDILYDLPHDDDTNSSSAFYFRGVAQYHLGLEGGAYNDFSDCSELCSDVAHQISSKEFLKILREEKWWSIYAFIGAHYQGNIFKQNGSTDQFRGYTNNASGYYSGFGVWLKMYENRSFGGFFTFDLNRRDYFDKLMKDFEPVNQKFGFEFDFKFGGKPHAPFFYFSVDPSLTMQYLSNERQADRLTYEVSFGFPLVLFEPEVFYWGENLTDPLPERDDILDPVTYEVVPLSDRSTNLVTYGLRWVWYANEAFDFYNQIYWRENRHKDTGAKSTNYDERKFTFGISYDTSRYNNFSTELFSRKRNFLNTVPQRTDLAIGLAVDWRHFVHSYLSFELGLEYLDQESDETSGSYGTTAGKIGMGVRF